LEKNFDVDGIRRRDLRSCTTHHLMSSGAGGRGGDLGGEVVGGGGLVLIEALVLEEGEWGVAFVCGKRDLSVVERRVFKFFSDMLNKVIIVCCNVLLLLLC